MSVEEQKRGARTSTLPPLQCSALTHSTDVGQRGFSRKLQEMVKQQKQLETSILQPHKREVFEKRNWKQLNAIQLNKMTSIQHSRYMMYEPTPKDIKDRQTEALRRVRAHRRIVREKYQTPLLRDLIEIEENSELIGQLKAAEAKYRIKTASTSYERERSLELYHLISSQPTAQEAIRLQSFIPPTPIYVNVPDYLSKSERNRCETILEDTLGLTINRTL